MAFTVAFYAASSRWLPVDGTDGFERIKGAVKDMTVSSCLGLN